MAAEPGAFELSITIGDASFSASGPSDLVLSSFAEFKELVASGAKPPARTPKPAAVSADNQNAPDGTVETRQVTTRALKPFLGEHTLKGNKEKITAILAWSAERDGEKDKLSRDELKTLWKQTGKVPAGFSRDLRAAEVEGWIESEGKGQGTVFFIAPVHGEDTVAGWKTAKG